VHPKRYLLIEDKRALIISPILAPRTQLQIKAVQQLCENESHLVVRKANTDAVARATREGLPRTLLVCGILGREPAFGNELVRPRPVVGEMVCGKLTNVDNCLAERQQADAHTIRGAKLTPPATNFPSMIAP
jgi:hypothetical protein